MCFWQLYYFERNKPPWPEGVVSSLCLTGAHILGICGCLYSHKASQIFKPCWSLREAKCLFSTQCSNGAKRNIKSCKLLRGCMASWTGISHSDEASSINQCMIYSIFASYIENELFGSMFLNIDAQQCMTYGSAAFKNIHLGVFFRASEMLGDRPWWMFWTMIRSKLYKKNSQDSTYTPEMYKENYISYEAY